jgi:hypothetical protein
VASHLNTAASCTVFLQNFFQRGFAAGVAADNFCPASLCTINRRPNHFMGNGACKEYKQIRRSDLFAEIRRHLCKYLCLTVK